MVNFRVSHLSHGRGKPLSHDTFIKGDLVQRLKNAPTNYVQKKKLNLFKTISFCHQLCSIIIIIIIWLSSKTLWKFVFFLVIEVSKNTLSFAPWPAKPKMFIACRLQRAGCWHLIYQIIGKGDWERIIKSKHKVRYRHKPKYVISYNKCKGETVPIRTEEWIYFYCCC